MAKIRWRTWREAWLKNAARGYLREDGRPEPFRSWLLRTIRVGLISGAAASVVTYLVADPSGWSKAQLITVVALGWMAMFMMGESLWRQVARMAAHFVRHDDIAESDSAPKS
ncbi:hypothetical protein [Cryptosporangium japonicum]|uniref:Uncharacterized protein n=1 Tax=Cryptosporangium japonicum TaxID=80872 RepID=A0ABN0V3F0_9ACTN